MSRLRPGRSFLAGSPMLVAHRGGAHLAPENTMAAFRIALDDWEADLLEVDARLSRDGRVVLIHDALVDRTCDGTGEVSDLDWADLEVLDAGYHFSDLHGQDSFRGRGVRIPLLDEVLEAFPTARLNLEAKVAEVAKPMVDLIRRHSAEDRVLIAAERERARRGARGYPGPWGASRGQIFAFWLRARTGYSGGYRPRFDILQVPEVWNGIRVVTPAFVKAAHAINVPVQVWTVDDEVDMRRLLEWGVDGIQTDRPDILAGVLMECGRAAPRIWRDA